MFKQYECYRARQFFTMTIRRLTPVAHAESQEFGRTANLGESSTILSIITSVINELMRQIPFVIIFHNVHYKYQLYGAVTYLDNGPT